MYHRLYHDTPVWLKSPPTPPTVMIGPQGSVVSVITLLRLNSIRIMSTFYVFFCFRSAIIALYYDIPTYSVKIQTPPTTRQRTYRYHRLLRADHYGRWCRWWLQSYPWHSFRHQSHQFKPSQEVPLCRPAGVDKWDILPDILPDEAFPGGWLGLWSQKNE